MYEINNRATQAAFTNICERMVQMSSMNFRVVL